MKFKSRKDILLQILMYGLITFFIGQIAYRVFILNYNFILIDLVLIIISALLLWMMLNTNYELTATELKYKSGFIKGKIEINRIREVKKGKTLWAGFKPATARNGLIIKYDKYEEIYISPKTNELFIKKLLEINKSIKISY